MSTSAYGNISEYAVSRHQADAPAGWAAARFYLPALVVALVFLISEHNTFYATPGFANRTVETNLAEEVGGTDVFRQIGYLTLGAMGAALLIQRRERPAAVSRLLLGLAAMACAWVLLSTLWADNIALSLKRALVPLLAFLCALGVAKHWRPRQVCLFTAVATGAYMAAGVLAEAAYGTFLSGFDYRFSGTLHPNNQALVCASFCLATISLYSAYTVESDKLRRRLWLAAFAVGLLMLVLTGSRTGTAAFLVAAMMYWYLGASRRSKAWSIGALVMLGAVCSVVVLEYSAGTGHALLEVARMGREQESEDMASLTGRIPIWTEVLGDVSQSPLIGYGYGAFWTPRRVQQYSYIHDWEFDHAHSAYFETLLNVGIVGLTIGLAAILLARRSAVRAYYASGDSGYRFFAALLTMALVHGLLDSNFVRIGFASTLSMICLAMTIFHTSRAHLKYE
jgi:exopolysaccharide production protein ExoQ